MIAVAILAIAFTSIVKFHTQTLNMNIASNFYIKAPLLAKELISEWEIGSFKPDSDIDLNGYIKDFPGFSFEMNNSEIETDFLDTGSADDNAHENSDENRGKLFEIICTILYNGGEYSYTMKTLRFITQSE